MGVFLSTTLSRAQRDDASTALDGDGQLARVDVGQRKFLYATSSSYSESGIEILEIGRGGALTSVGRVFDGEGGNLSGAFAITSVNVGGKPFLIAGGSTDSGLESFSVRADGRLTSVGSFADNTAVQLRNVFDLDSVVLGGRAFVIAAGQGDNGLTVFEVSAAGKLAARASVADSAIPLALLQSPQAVEIVQTASGTFVYAAAYRESGLSAFRLGTNGSLAFIGAVGDTTETALQNPTDLASLKIGGKTFVFATSAGYESVTTFSVERNGALREVATFADADPRDSSDDVSYGRSLFAGSVGGQNLLVHASEYYGRLTIFAIGADGRLERLGKIEDEDGRLDDVRDFDFIDLAGRPFLLARSEDGVSVLEFGGGDDALVGTALGDTLLGLGDDDELLGRAGDDRLDGGIGNDLLSGGAGDDRLIGGEGADTVLGGAGVDTLDYAASTRALVVNLAAGTTSGGPAAGDVIFGVENVVGGRAADRLTGSAGANRIEGGAGADRVDGLGGADRLIGGTGNDTLSGGDANDRLLGGGQNDQLLGGAGGDALFGDAGNDALLGDAGDDTLSGGAGNDRLTAGAGRDKVTGGAGADVFVFATGFEQASITDFAAGDRIDLSGTSVTSFSGLSRIPIGADVAITFVNGDALIVQDTTLAELGATVFIF